MTEPLTSTHSQMLCVELFVWDHQHQRDTSGDGNPPFPLAIFFLKLSHSARQSSIFLVRMSLSLNQSFLCYFKKSFDIWYILSLKKKYSLFDTEIISSLDVFEHFRRANAWNFSVRHIFAVLQPSRTVCSSVLWISVNLILKMCLKCGSIPHIILLFYTYRHIHKLIEK